MKKIGWYAKLILAKKINDNSSRGLVLWIMIVTKLFHQRDENLVRVMQMVKSIEKVYI